MGLVTVVLDTNSSVEYPGRCQLLLAVKINNDNFSATILLTPIFCLVVVDKYLTAETARRSKAARQNAVINQPVMDQNRSAHRQVVASLIGAFAIVGESDDFHSEYRNALEHVGVVLQRAKLFGVRRL